MSQNIKKIQEHQDQSQTIKNVNLRNNIIEQINYSRLNDSVSSQENNLLNKISEEDDSKNEEISQNIDEANHEINKNS